MIDPELISKAVIETLQEQLGTAIDQVRLIWTAQHTHGSWIVPTDDFDLPHPAPGDIVLGRTDLVTAESNFPAFYVFVSSERPVAEGEQNWASMDLVAVVRIVVQGLTIEHTQKMLYRYCQAVRVAIKTNVTLFSLGLLADQPQINYEVNPNNPLYMGATMQFSVQGVD